MTFDLAQWKRDYHAEHDVDPDAAPAEYPPPEVAAREPVGDEMPASAKTLVKKIEAAGLPHRVSYARGTWPDQYGRPTEVAETCVVTTRESIATWRRIPGKMVTIARPKVGKVPMIGPLPQKLEGWKFHSAQIRGESGLVSSKQLTTWLEGQNKEAP